MHIFCSLINIGLNEQTEHIAIDIMETVFHNYPQFGAWTTLLSLLTKMRTRSGLKSIVTGPSSGRIWISTSGLCCLIWSLASSPFNPTNSGQFSFVAIAPDERSVERLEACCANVSKRERLLWMFERTATCSTKRGLDTVRSYPLVLSFRPDLWLTLDLSETIGQHHDASIH